ncbi:MAG: T9SS type A sorting domain-containing protein, partial [Muribaculaceae bacterium]|nr:T9SS type A sorting domain-containing protein [Muribaculaceae bacterium]
DNIYALIEDKAEVVPGESFTLNLIAKSLGEYSTSTVRQDIRYTCAYIWADWYGLSEWEKVQFHGTVPPSHNVGGNYDVLNIAQALTMPADVPVGTEGRIRVIYSSALSVPGTNSSDQNQGMEAADPNSQYINGGIAYDIVVNAVAAPVPTYAVTIAETEATVEANVEDLTAVEEGTEVTFTITAPEGKQIASVTYNDETISANEDGTYTITVNADGTLSVTLEDIPQPGKALLVPSANGRNIYTFRIDDAVLGSHTNGSCDANDLRSHNFTYSAWINIKNTTSGPIMGNIQSQFIDATGAFVVSLKDGKLNLSGRGNTSDSGYANEQPSATETTDPGTANDEWVFVSVVADREAKTVTLYKNCKAISHYDVTNKIGLLPDKSSFFIGGNGTSVEFTEVQLWNKALTPDELMDSYNLKFTETPENLAAYYKPAELVEGSTTDLRNLGTVGTDVPGQLLMGTSSYDSSQWTYVYNGTPQDIELIDEDRVLGTAAITLVQPATEGNSFKVTDAKGKEIAAEVTLFEKLNVVPALAEGVEVLGVIVEADGVKTTYTLDQFPIRATGDMTISLRLNDLFKVIATAENGTVTISVNDGEATAVAAEGTEVANGSKVVLTFTGNEGAVFKSLTVNGEDAQLTDGTYTIDAIDADYTLAAIYDLFTYKLTIINPSDDPTPENNVYGEFVDNQMNRLEYEDADGLDVTPGATVYLLISFAENHGVADSYYEFTKLTDNGVEVPRTNLFPGGENCYIYPMSNIQADHTFVIDQQLYDGIIGVGVDAEGMISFAGYTIRVAADNAQIDIFDLNGRTLRSVAANEITVSDLVKGVYFAKATVNGKAYTFKFIKL